MRFHSYIFYIGAGIIFFFAGNIQYMYGFMPAE